ncbi:MAG TPA: hypothetical protein VK791_02525, partial [bacterium]|nr:hypothetical protein [bacterium]
MKLIIGLLVLLSLYVSPVNAQVTDLDLRQVLELAEKASPTLKAAMNRENGARESSTIAESNLFP